MVGEVLCKHFWSKVNSETRRCTSNLYSAKLITATPNTQDQPYAGGVGEPFRPPHSGGLGGRPPAQSRFTTINPILC
jgi:hypothetical protein